VHTYHCSNAMTIFGTDSDETLLLLKMSFDLDNLIYIQNRP